MLRLSMRLLLVMGTSLKTKYLLFCDVRQQDKPIHEGYCNLSVEQESNKE